MVGQNGTIALLSADAATQIATAYIAATFGPAFSIQSVELTGMTWWVRIQCRHPEADEPLLVGHILVDGVSGEVLPLDSAQIVDIQERAQLLVAHRKQELGRDERGYLLPSQARVKANGYVAGYLAFFASAEGLPEWVEGTPPYWRVAIALKLRGQGNVCDLGFVDVNALTGEVVALSEEEISIRQRDMRAQVLC